MPPAPALMEQWSRQNIPPNKHRDQRLCCWVPAAKALPLLSKPSVFWAFHWLHSSFTGFLSMSFRNSVTATFTSQQNQPWEKWNCDHRRKAFGNHRGTCCSDQDGILYFSTHRKKLWSKTSFKTCGPYLFIDLTNLNNSFILWAS